MDKSKKLTEIAEQVKICQRCPLYKTATHGVPGEGNPNADIMFIGEAPGFHEDRLARPFVGAAGKLLDKALASINIKRDDVFIGNMIKHRPPGNRDPLPSELTACSIYIDAQIKALTPKLIVTLGRFSMAKFFGDTVRISQIHGRPRWVTRQDQKQLVMPLYHPAAALRQGAMMEAFLADFRRIPQILALLDSEQTVSATNGETKSVESDSDTDTQLKLI